MENQRLKESLENKIELLKEGYKKRLSEKQKGLIEVLLLAQQQIIQLEEKPLLLVSREAELKRTKTSLKTKLSEKEIEEICQLQIELTKIKMQLENKLETKIEFLANIK